MAQERIRISSDWGNLTAKLVDTDCKAAALTLLSHGLRTSHRLRRNSLRTRTQRSAR